MTQSQWAELRQVGLGRRVVSHPHPLRLTRARITALTAAHTCGLRGGHGTKPLVRLT